MRPLTTVLNLLLLSLLCAHGLQGQPANSNKTKYAFVKQKSLTESFPVKKGDAAIIKNEFGKVTIHTWNQDEVKVSVNAEVTCDKEQWASTLFNRISFSHGKKDNTVNFSTVITGNMSNGQWITDTESYTNTINIDYEVYLPAYIRLSIDNQFGDITVPDFNSSLAIKGSFGKLYAGKLMQPDIDLEFGSADIKELGSGKASFSFTNDPVVINNLSGTLNLNASNCGKSGITVGIGEELNQLAITAEYSDIQAVVNNKLPYKADFNLSNGKMVNKTTLAIKEIPQENEEDMLYSLNSSVTGKEILVKTSYGNIMLTNTKMPMPKGAIRHASVGRGSSSGGGSSGSKGTGSRSGTSSGNGSGSKGSGGSSSSGSGGGGKSTPPSGSNETVSSGDN